MARRIDRLNALGVSRAKKRDLYPDGGGLYLQVAESGAKSWIFRFMLKGNPRTMGLGALKTVSLADARIAARDARSLCDGGIDPIEHREARRAEALIAAASSKLFEDCAKEYHEAHKAGWRSQKHVDEWIARAFSDHSRSYPAAAK